MGLLQRIKNTFSTRSSLENPSVSLVEWLNGGQSNQSGTMVTKDTALSVSAAWRCESLISGSIASLPVMVYEITEKGRTALPSHPISQLLKNPSSFYTGFTLFERLTKNLISQGILINLKEREGLLLAPKRKVPQQQKQSEDLAKV